MGISNYLWTNISFIIMFMLHMVQHRIGVATLNSGTLEENQKGCASQLENSRKPFPIVLITENVVDLRPIIFLFTDRYFIEFNRRKPVPLLYCSDFCSLPSASFPVHQHCAGTPAILRACKTLSCLADHKHKHQCFCLSWVE